MRVRSIPGVPGTREGSGSLSLRPSFRRMAPVRRRTPCSRNILRPPTQKVEHYEISSYLTARTMAQQLGQPDIAQLLSKTLAEEENADCVLAVCARPLMSEARLVESE